MQNFQIQASEQPGTGNFWLYRTLTDGTEEIKKFEITVEASLEFDNDDGLAGNPVECSLDEIHDIVSRIGGLNSSLEVG